MLKLHSFNPDIPPSEKRNKFVRFINPSQKVGRFIKELRTDQDLSQRELVEKTNIILSKIGATQIPDKSALSRIESGRRELKYLEGLALAVVLKVDPENFWVRKNISYLPTEINYQQTKVA